MRAFLFYIIAVFVVISTCHAQKNENVLIFTKTAGFRHQSIPKGISTVADLLSQHQINSTHTEDTGYFCPDSLAKFDAVILLNTSGDIFTESQEASFQKFIQSGKGFVGIHAASDTEFSWPWYGQLVGAHFTGHPPVQDAEIEIVDNNHQSTSHLQRIWFHRDEWYDFKNVKEGLNILMLLKEESYKGSKMGKFHPIAWFQEFDGGRSFYTGLGHTEESYDSLDFQKHILGGIFYVLKRN